MSELIVGLIVAIVFYGLGKENKEKETVEYIKRRAEELGIDLEYEEYDPESPYPFL